MNVNMFRELTNTIRTRTAVRETVLGSDLMIRPQAFATREDAESWGQVFNLAASEKPAWSLAAASTDLTLWGTGALTIRTSSEASLKRLVSAAVSPDVAERLIELLSAETDDDDESQPVPIEDRLGLRRRQRGRLQRVTTTDSRCHSLWLLPEHSPARGEFHVLDRTGQRGDVHSFIW